MAKIKSLVKKHAVEIAVRRRTCANNGSTIHKGETCLVVFDGPRDRYCYCREVAQKMIDQARLTLLEIESALNTS